MSTSNHTQVQFLCFYLIILVNLIWATNDTIEFYEPQNITSSQTNRQDLKLVEASICLIVKNHEAYSSATNFSRNVDQLFCFNHFKGKAKATTIVHKWYFRNELQTSIGLRVKPGKWRTYSSKQIETDQIGDWKVEIVNCENGALMKILHFRVE